MIELVYALAACGFINAGWPFWRSFAWPYYIAKSFAAKEDRG